MKFEEAAPQKISLFPKLFADLRARFCSNGLNLIFKETLKAPIPPKTMFHS